MKYSFIFGLVAVAAAAPTQDASVIQARQKTGATATEFTDGGCAQNIFVFARGTSEPGNMGQICGPQTADALKQKLGASSVAVEGVDYAAAVGTNLSPGGGDPKGVQEMMRLVTKAATDCPNSNILVGGYSQGAAVLHGAMEAMPAAALPKIKGAVTFGDTQNQQSGGQIPNVPADQQMIICAKGDAVCRGTLTILPAHLSYGNRADDAATFLASTVQ